MKIRGMLVGLLLAGVVAYVIFFTPAAGRKGGVEIMVDKYARVEGQADRRSISRRSRARSCRSPAEGRACRIRSRPCAASTRRPAACPTPGAGPSATRSSRTIPSG
ncbi:MAG: hypothetical protein M0C28_00500 [Candidatus Moduliflexus flocculans]|nr:hypothetical protein [Candidatus Moduliflexus flocculans]